MITIVKRWLFLPVFYNFAGKVEFLHKPGLRKCLKKTESCAKHSWVIEPRLLWNTDRNPPVRYLKQPYALTLVDLSRVNTIRQFMQAAKQCLYIAHRCAAWHKYYNFAEIWCYPFITCRRNRDRRFYFEGQYVHDSKCNRLHKSSLRCLYWCPVFTSRETKPLQPTQLRNMVDLSSSAGHKQKLKIMNVRRHQRNGYLLGIKCVA